MKKSQVLEAAIVILGIGYTSCAQEIVPGNRIAVTVSASAEKTLTLVRFDYVVANGKSAEQDLIEFTMVTDTSVTIASKHAPDLWKVTSFYEGDLMVRWFAVANEDTGGHVKPINPGKKLEGFSLLAKSLPGIVTFYAEGSHPLPEFEPGMATDSIPGYSDLTPYGPGVVGRTIGPVSINESLMPTAFIDTIVSYKHLALELGWIKNQGMVTSLDQKLENAKTQIQKGNTTSALNILKAFVNEVAALNKEGGKITSEAYALLKFNAEYLMERLGEK